MIGLDTNILVRYFAQDDPRQSTAARKLIDDKLTREEPGYIAIVVLVEFAWVLKRLYEGKRSEIAEAIAGLLSLNIPGRAPRVRVPPAPTTRCVPV